MCIVREDKWQVYYSERGNKRGIKTFETETEVCEYFLRKLKKICNKFFFKRVLSIMKMQTSVVG